MGIEVRTLAAEEAFDSLILQGLVAILRDAVSNNYAVGFLQSDSDAHFESFWRDELADINSGNNVLCAFDDRELVGVLIVNPEKRSRENHRAELRKFLIRADYQRQGIGSLLEKSACELARKAGLKLLYLDSATDYAVSDVYEKWGWTKVGTIPNFATHPDGSLTPTTYFYKELK